MRKNVIALMLVLPILFVLVVYSAVNTASLDVPITANGIEIMERYPNDTVTIDLADYGETFEITPRVTPANASNRAFEYRYERISGSMSEEEVAAGGVVEVVTDSSGTDKIRAHAVGTVRIVAVSKDGGFEDSITAIVGASKPYAFDFSLYKADDAGKNDVLEADGDGYTAAVPAGQYGYSIRLKPNTYLSPSFEISEGFVRPDLSRGTLMLPFTGKTAFDVVIPSGVDGTLVRHVELDVVNPELASAGFSVNGETDARTAVQYDREANRAEFFIEAAERPAVECADAESVEILQVEGTQNGWQVVAELPPVEDGEEFTFYVTAGGKSRTVTVTPQEFLFSIRTDMPVFDEEAGTNILMGTPVSFYAVPNVATTGITYRWDAYNVEDMNKLDMDLSAGEDHSVCTITANERDTFILVVEALRNGEPIYNSDAHEVVVEVINNVIEVTGVDTRLGLAKSRAVAGLKYENGEKVKNIYPVPVTAYSPSGALADGIYDLDFSVSSKIAEVVRDDFGEPLMEDGCIFLDIKGKGTVTLHADWKGNAEWRADETPVGSDIVLTVDSEAVEVTTSNQFFTETAAGNPVVLGADIMLGTDDFGRVLDVETRRGMIKSMRSTYNTQFYETTGQDEQAYVSYVAEIKNDLYGNGHTVCGEYFSNAQGNAGEPLFFKGPRALVKLGDMASVAAQDNIVFLCRTDGVTIYNAELLGCSDESRRNPETQLDDLTTLNNTGTVLEINADVNVFNCRIRNGRNVVRVYGGNRSGTNYFIESLSENRTTSQDQIVVRIEGCILSHSREFIVKTGTNRALRASARLGREPYLTDRNGRNYQSQTDSYLDDDFFYSTYVLTDLTIADCVLSTSGLFCVGVESNFAGEALCEGGRYAGHEVIGQWVGVGGTSFAATVRLEGDVRMYDWKDLKNVNSETLIQANSPDFPLKLDIGAMIEYVSSNDPSRYGSIVDAQDGVNYVHGGIAVYGGGRNYSQLSLRGLDPARASGLEEFDVNLSELESAEGEVGGLGQLLPLAAGTQSFRFFLYDSKSANNRAWQENASYTVQPVPFE